MSKTDCTAINVKTTATFLAFLYNPRWASSSRIPNSPGEDSWDLRQDTLLFPHLSSSLRLHSIFSHLTTPCCNRPIIHTSLGLVPSVVVPSLTFPTAPLSRYRLTVMITSIPIFVILDLIHTSSTDLIVGVPLASTPRSQRLTTSVWVLCCAGHTGCRSRTTKKKFVL